MRSFAEGERCGVTRESFIGALGAAGAAAAAWGAVASSSVAAGGVDRSAQAASKGVVFGEVRSAAV